MKKLATCVALVCVLVGAGVPTLACAQAQNLYQSSESLHARPHSDIHGEIESIDYGSNTIVVRSGHERYTIAVLPSTQIYGGSEYSSFSDLKRGVAVQVTASEVSGALVAQSIHVH